MERSTTSSLFPAYPLGVPTGILWGVLGGPARSLHHISIRPISDSAEGGCGGKGGGGEGENKEGKSIARMEGGAWRKEREERRET